MTAPGDDGAGLLFAVRVDDVGIATSALPLLGTYATPTPVPAPTDVPAAETEDETSS